MAYSWIPKIVYNSTTINFDFPPAGADFKGESYKTVGTITTSKSGIQQTVIDYIEKTNSINFSFVSETVKAQLETFLETHALSGKEFDFYFDKADNATKVTVKLDKGGLNPKFKIITRKGNGFIYKITLKFRRVIA